MEPGTRFGSWTVRDNTVVNKHRMHQVVAECDCGKFAVVIAANLRDGKTKCCHSCASVEHGFQARLHRDQVQQLRRRLRAGENARVLAEEFGITRGHVNQIDRGLLWRTLPWPEGVEPRKTRSGMKLTRADVAEIRRRVALGEKQYLVADAFGISFKHVSGLWRGECFSDVPWPEGRTVRK